MTTVWSLQGYLAHKKRLPLGIYSRPMPRALWWRYTVGGGVLMSGVALYTLGLLREHTSPRGAGETPHVTLPSTSTRGLSPERWGGRVIPAPNITARQGNTLARYRGTSRIRNRTPLGPHSGPMPRALWWSCGGPMGGAVCYERGTPVRSRHVAPSVSSR